MKNTHITHRQYTNEIRSEWHYITILQAFMLCVTLLLSGCQLTNMVQFSYANATATHSWVDDARTTTVGFELIDDHIILPVSVNGSEPLRFVLDSGAAATVILESTHSKKLPLEMAGKVEVSGVGTGPNPVAYIINDTNLALGNVRLDGLSVIYLPITSVPFFNDFDEVYFDGVIGAQFFERFVVEIDYDRQLLSFSEPESDKGSIFKRDSGWQEVPIEVHSSLPFLTTQIAIEDGQSLEIKLLIDTGYRGPISLTPDTHEGIEEPSQFYTTTSQGMSGSVQSKVGLSHSINLGSSILTAVPVSFFISGGHTDYGSNGLLGNEVLSRFNLIFDYPNERMFIKPNQSFPVPLYLDRSGMLIRPHRIGAVVKSVAKDSAAYAIGLKTNDLITSIDGTRVTHLNITELKRLLSSEREAVSVCWMLTDQQTCGELTLSSRLRQDEL